MADEKNAVPTSSQATTREIDLLKANVVLLEAMLKRMRRNSRIWIGILLAVLVFGLGYVIWNGFFRSENGTAQSLDVADLRINYLEDNFNQLRIIIYVLGGLGAALGATLSIRGETRNTQNHHAAVARESSTSTMSAQLFDQSLKTIELVNQTLGLAKDATQSAAKVHQERIDSEIKLLKIRTGTLLAKANARRDYKQLVENARLVHELERIYDRQKGFEETIDIYNIEVPAEFHFVNGMIDHTKENPEDAIDHLETASSKADREGNFVLKGFADYWRAYELDIMAKHDEAAHLFDHMAREEKDPYIKIVLKTHAIESWFFESAEIGDLPTAARMRDMAEAAVDEMVATDDEDEIRARDGLYLLIGNISVWLAYAHSPGTKPQFDLTFLNNVNSCEALNRALIAYGMASPSLWSRIGVLEVKKLLSMEVNEADYNVIVYEAMDRHSKRREPRSRLLLAATATIAKARTYDDYTLENKTYKDDLGEVGDDVRLYSPFRKCNAKMADVENEMKEFLKSTPIRSRSAQPAV